MYSQKMRAPAFVDPALADHCKQCDARHSAVCDAMPESDLGRLAAVAVEKTVGRGQVFIDEGESADNFYSVTQGAVKLFKLLPDGRQQITGFAGFGHFLGLAVFKTYAFSAQALGTVKLCSFSRIKLRRLLDDFPVLERRLLENACKELAAAQEQMLLLGRKTARERLASFIVARSRDATPCGDDPDHIDLPMTRGDIADYLGLTIETVSRTISAFRAGKRILTPSNSEIILLDRRWLTCVSSGDPQTGPQAPPRQTTVMAKVLAKPLSEYTPAFSELQRQEWKSPDAGLHFIRAR
jgi:CRP/FNR family transcriptional regulator